MTTELATDRADIYRLRHDKYRAAEVAEAAANVYGLAFDAELAAMRASGVTEHDEAMDWMQQFEIGYQQWLAANDFGDEVEEWAHKHIPSAVFPSLANTEGANT
jgi:hypothetical protein